MKLVLITFLSMISITAKADDEITSYDARDFRGSCEVEMINNNGGFIEDFKGRDCREALWYCENALEQRHRQGLNPYARCVVVDRNGRGDRDDWDRDGRGGHDGGRRPPPPPYNPPRNGSYVCTASDRGWEEHAGAHVGYGRTQFEAERSAINVCRRQHGDCFISQCRIGY